MAPLRLGLVSDSVIEGALPALPALQQTRLLSVPQETSAPHHRRALDVLFSEWNALSLDSHFT